MLFEITANETVIDRINAKTKELALNEAKFRMKTVFFRHEYAKKLNSNPEKFTLYARQVKNIPD